MRASLLLALLAACSGDDAKPADTDPADDTGDTDTDPGDTGDTGDTAAPPDPAAACAELGLTVRPFTEAAASSALFATAADFTVQTTEGPWNLRERWSGCDTYLFIPDEPAQASGWPEPLWGLKRDTRELFERLPPNVHLFFVSGEMGGDNRDAALSDLKAQVDDILDGAGTADWWGPRVHYVTERSTQIEGWLGETFVSPNWGTAIDRFQRIRYIGSFADPSRYNSSYGWFEPNLSMAANEAIHYDFESDRADRQEAQGADVIRVWDQVAMSDGGWAGVRTDGELVLPDAAIMATYDALELDLTMNCAGEGEYGTCPAWDYLVYLYLCDEADPTDCSMEFGRWITTYHREGRWTLDATSMLPYLANGGTRKVQFYTQQLYEITLDVRLWDRGSGERPVEATHLFSGGTFDTNYNVDRAPVTVAIPADATRVELATTISGHGMASPGNCAEFCDTQHTFYVNGTANERSFPDAGSELGCMEATDEGTTPNQYGTWWYGRSGWCPGKEVPIERLDITDQVVLGADNVFEYVGRRNGEAYTGGGAWMDVQAWVVVYR